MIDAKWPKAAMSAAVFALALGLAGCVEPTGPVFGEWQGEPPGRSRSVPKSVDLVLEGTPDAQSGAYRIATTEHDPSVLAGHGTRRWGGTWTRSPRTVDGQQLTIITLHDHLPDDIGDYTLAADGKLHALDPNGKIDTSRDGALYTLSPVQPRT